MRRDSDRIAELSREIDANPHSRQFYQLGELLRREGRAEEAAAVLRRGLQYWPKYVAAWVSLGRAELERRAAEGASAALEKALELDPENPVAWRLLAEAREVAGESERAVAAMRRAAALVPGDETLLQALHRLEGLAAAPLPPPEPAAVPPAVAPRAAPPEPGTQREEIDVEETAVVGLRALPLPEPFAQQPVVVAGIAAPPLAEEERAGAAAEAEPFAIVGPEAEVVVEAEAEEAVEPEPQAPPPLAPAPAEQPPAPIRAAPFGELAPPGRPATESAAALAGDVFAVEAPVAAEALEDVFGAPEEAPPAAAEALQEPQDVSPWATQARFVVPIPPPTAVVPETGAAQAAVEEPPVAVPEPGEALLLTGEPAEELWPAAQVETEPPEAVVETAAPIASVEAARALIRAERLAEAAAMLAQVVEERGEDGEARDLLELVRDMLEPMPVELPPLSRRERKIAALQRWLASLTLARERAAL